MREKSAFTELVPGATIALPLQYSFSALYSFAFKWAPSFFEGLNRTLCVHFVHSHCQKPSFFNIGNPETSLLDIDVINVFLHAHRQHSFCHDSYASKKSHGVMQHIWSHCWTKSVWISSCRIPPILSSPFSTTFLATVPFAIAWRRAVAVFRPIWYGV